MVGPSSSAIQPPSSHDSYDAKNEDLIEDETQTSADNEASVSTNRETEEKDMNKSKKPRKISSKKTEQTSGSYNRYFLSNFKIENIFSFNKKNDFRLSQDKVGLILSDPCAFEKLQAHLRQEGCVTDGTIRVNYNDLLRTRLIEIEESHDESKEDELSYSGVSQGVLDEVAPSTIGRDVRSILDSDLNAISGSNHGPSILDSECATPAKGNRLHNQEDTNSSEGHNSNADQATKSSASSSPTSVMEMMDLEMKNIDPVADTSEDEDLYNKKDASEDEFVEDDSSVDSGLFVENSTFSRPAASAPVAARPWGPDSAAIKEEKIWDICAVAAPATTMDFDHLWEDEDDDSEVDLSPYRRDPYDSSSDEGVYNDADYSSRSKDDNSERISSSNGESSRSNPVRPKDVEFAFDPNQVISREPEKKGQRVRFSIKKEFAYPSPGHETSQSRDSQEKHEDDCRTTSAKIDQRKAASLPKKRISRRQKRYHVIETLEI